MIVLVLDLDHTLVHSIPDRFVPGFEAFVIPRSENSDYVVHIRPWVLHFIDLVTRFPNKVRLVIWTAATDDYARHVVEGMFDMLDKPRHWRSYVSLLLTRKDTTRLLNGDYVKDMRIIRDTFDTDNVLLLDDAHIHAQYPPNAGHVVQIPPFVANANSRTDHMFEVFSNVLKGTWHGRRTLASDCMSPFPVGQGTYTR